MGREVIVSEQPPYANELENCIVRCPSPGTHHVLLNLNVDVELAPGKYTWTDKDNVSEYTIQNVVFSKITYDVHEPSEIQDQTFWTWLHALVFGPPPVQTVLLSFDVSQVSVCSSSESVRV